jgi:hypothetical protein
MWLGVVPVIGGLLMYGFHVWRTLYGTSEE